MDRGGENMSDLREEDDLMTAEDWKTMYLLLFRAQADILERFDELTGNEVHDRLVEAMQAAEEWYISRGDEV